MSKLAKRIFAAAGDYAALGFHVFPLSPQTKIPLKDSGGLNDASADQEQIYNWWNDYPEANVGINCGASGLVVLDIDVKHGKDARPAVEGKDMRGAPCVQTPSGGLHYYFRADGHKFQSGANLYGFDGLDIRSAGGYVVAPPSCIIEHPGEQAREYKLVSGSFDNIPPVPQWLVDWERERQAKSAAADAPAGDSAPIPDDPATTERARRYLDAMPEAISGQGGHVATLKAATALVVGFRLSDDAALKLLRESYNPRCRPSWSEKELRHKVEEARKNQRGRRWGYLLRYGLAPLCNYNLTRGPDGKERETPRLLLDICADVRSRFDGFPKRMGERLFDLDPDGGEIRSIIGKDALAAWIQRRGGCLIDFKGGRGFPRMAELYEGLLDTAVRYDAAAKAPFYPPRARVFALHGELPKPTEGAATFWRLMDFFCPATDEDRILMAALFVSPLFFSAEGDIDRPGWGVDTVDAQGSGKTSVVDAVAKMYDCDPIRLDFASLDSRQSDVKKRLISTEGRASRIALFDNVTKTVNSAILSDFITAKGISERAAYGRGEETRPNDLTYILTMNGGRFDSDAATRFYTVKIKEPEKRRPFWKRDVMQFISDHQLQLYADMISLLEATARRRAGGGGLMQRHRSRFPEFDAIVLASVCRSADEFHAVDAYLSSEMAEANDDRERAAIFDGILLTALKTCPDWCEGLPTVIYKGDIDALLSINRTTASWRVNKNHIGQWVKAGYLPRFYNGRWEGLSNMRDNPEWREAHFLYGIDKFNGDEPTTVQIFRGDWGNHDGRTSGRIVGTVVRGRPR